MAAAARAVAAVRSAAATAAAGGARRMYSIFADLDLKREPDLLPKVEPSTKLFVAGLNKQTTSEALKEAFSKFGLVVDAHVVTDRVTGLSKGFGFVRYATLEEAEAGKKGMDNKFLDGWVLLADYAKPKPPPTAAPVNWRSPPSFQGISHNNAMGGNPQSPPPYQSQPSYHSPPSYQSQPSYRSPPSNEHNSFNNVVPVNPQTRPSVQNVNLNNVMAGNSQSPPPYGSQPSYQRPPVYESQPSYHPPPSNEHYAYKNVASMNPQNPPSYQDVVNNAVAGNPPSPFPYQTQPSHQCPPSNEHNNYNNVAPANRQSPPFYHHEYGSVSANSYQPTSNSNQVPVNHSQSPTPYQQKSYNGYSNMGPANPQSPPFYQQNTSDSMVSGNPHSPPSHQHSNYDYQMAENTEAEPSYQYGG